MPRRHEGTKEGTEAGVEGKLYVFGGCRFAHRLVDVCSGVAAEIGGDIYFTTGSGQTTTWKGVVS